ncbi:MAG TPA: TonB-dependent receptor [Steroidobacter sp.]|uniref:TonB-dependent receptor n=1 Tax=Steroidobacter sp. TaxID=1978227 RepID=UPI002ED79C7A
MIRVRSGRKGLISTHVRAALGGIACLAGAQAAHSQVIEEIITTAQRRESDLQTTAIAVSAYSGDNLAENAIFTAVDLAQDTPAFSLTAVSPLDLELNIRGITNTRLDSPSSDPSVGVFIDEVYVGRTGTFSTDFYDLERIEVIRGPQGVLLGKNVVGGALSIITAKPEFDTSGKLTVSLGNYGSMLASGYVTGGLTDSLAARFSFQTRNHDGYAKDVLNDRDLEDLDSVQSRAQLLYDGGDSGLKARLSLDYVRDRSNGMNTVALRDPTAAAPGPWSEARAYFGITNVRQSAPSNASYVGRSTEQGQFLERDAWGAALHIDKQLGSTVLSSITAYRDGDAHSMYDQTGLGFDLLNNSLAEFAAMVAERPRTALLFNYPINEQEQTKEFSQEVRLASDYDDSRWDWIVGVYYKHDEIDKFDRNAAEAIAPPLGTLNGEVHWDNSGETDSYAAFAQAGYKFTDALKLSVGLRYTKDEKSGRVSGLSVATGDRFNPAETTALTPLQPTFAAGTGFETSYGNEWSRVTPQAILSWEATDDLFTYVSVASGFKGGGFEDTPANAAGARFSFDPEKATNYEIGFKSDLLDHALRLNVSAFFMDYTDLQVQQLDQGCVCLITDNASDAEIKGVELELTYLPTASLALFASGSLLDTEYLDFIESTGVDSSGNKLQRTPDYQYTVGFEYSMSVGNWTEALKFRASYAYQDAMFWEPANVHTEDGYGLLDARLSLAPPHAPWRVSIWGRNLTDELYRTNVVPFFGDEVSQFGPPRTYGADFSWSF